MGLRAVASVENDIPSLDDQHQVSLAQTSAIYDAKGNLLAYLHGVENRTVISGKQIPQILRNAVVAIEDERFYQPSRRRLRELHAGARHQCKGAADH